MGRFYIASIIDNFVYLYTLILIVRIISSWFPELQSSRAIGAVRAITDPYLDLFRRIIPPIGMLDISPILAFFSLQIIASIIKSILLSV